VRKKPDAYLAKREQQIMDIVYRLGRADVATVMEELPMDLSNSAVRSHLRILEAKGHLKHIEEDGKFVYLPAHPRSSAARNAVKGLLNTFFDNSLEKVVMTLLSVKSADIQPDELERLGVMIEQAKQKATEKSDDENES